MRRIVDAFAKKRIDGALRGKRTTSDAMLTMRVPADLLARGDALVPKVAADTDLATTMGRVTRSAVLRLALLEGVKTLERRYKV